MGGTNLQMTYDFSDFTCIRISILQHLAKEHSSSNVCFILYVVTQEGRKI
jgi:hypothetical protein